MKLLSKEYQETLILAVPIIVGQFSQMLMGLADSVMIGRVGTVPLAASAFTGSIFNLFFITAIGLLTAVTVLVAREHGRHDENAAGEWLRHGMAIALVSGAIGGILMAWLGAKLVWFGQPAEVLAAIQPYYLLISVSLIPTLGFQVLRQFSEAMNRPWEPMGIMLGSVVLNVFLNWIFIYGHLGVPALGLAGAGWATLASRIAGLVVLWLWLARAEVFAQAWPKHWTGRFSMRHIREMMGLGVPGAFMLLFEVGTFSAAAMMMGWIGADALAAHQIAITCAGLTFMFPLGLSMAVSIRVGRAVGGGRRDLLRPIGMSAFAMTCVLMLVFALILAFGGRMLASGFVDDQAVVDLAAQMLIVAALFQLVDGGQIVAAGALRGLHDVRVPTVINLVAYWGVAVLGGYFAGVRGPLGPVGIWIGLAAGMTLAATLLIRRFVRLTRPEIVS